jgi:hypothetical protein
LIAAAVNIAFKVLLMGPLAQIGWRWRRRSAPGSISAWCSGLPRAPVICRVTNACAGQFCGSSSPASCSRQCCGCVTRPLPVGRDWRGLRDLATLGVLAIIGAVVYAGSS